MAAYPKLLKALASFHPLPRGAHLGIALSGGPDSSALLGLLLRYRERRRPDLKLVAGHVHHGLRGEEADGDLELCQDLARRLPFKLVVTHVDVPRHAASLGISMETSARLLRLEAFARWSREEGLIAMTTAHTSDDQVETVLGNILRGSGLTGLEGMPAERPLPGAPGTRLLRPLLGISRSELATFLKSVAIPSRQDTSNQDLRYRRNRLRHQLLPLLERDYNPAVRRAILGLASEAEQLKELRERLLEPFKAAFITGPRIVAAPLKVLRGATGDALLSPLLDYAWWLASGKHSALVRDHHRAWCQIIRGRGQGNCYALPGGWQLERASGWIYLLGLERDSPAPPTIRVSSGRTALDWLDGELEIQNSGIPGTPLAEHWVNPNTVIRAANADDRIATEAGHGRVFEMLRARGVPMSLRRRFPLLARGEEVVWIPGIRTAPLLAPSPWRARLQVNPNKSSEGFLVARLLADAH